MNPAPSTELADRLGQAEAALEKDDLETADAHLASAADLCRRLQAAGLGIPPQELDGLRALAERLGTSLVNVGRRLNAESHRDENLRRGIVSYHATLTR